MLYRNPSRWFRLWNFLSIKSSTLRSNLRTGKTWFQRIMIILHASCTEIFMMHPDCTRRRRRAAADCAHGEMWFDEDESQRAPAKGFWVVSRLRCANAHIPRLLQRRGEKLQPRKKSEQPAPTVQKNNWTQTITKLLRLEEIHNLKSSFPATHKHLSSEKWRRIYKWTVSDAMTWRETNSRVQKRVATRRTARSCTKKNYCLWR